MQENNNNSLSKRKGMNADLINLRDDFDQFRTTINSQLVKSLNNTNYSSTNNSRKTYTKFPKKMHIGSKHYNLLINKNVDENKNYNINFKIDDQIENSPIINNTKRIKKVPNLNDKYIYKKVLDSIKNLNKSKTQINFFSPNNSFKKLKNIFSSLQKTTKNSLEKKKLNKTNSFNALKDNTIYFNSSLDSFYAQSKREKLKTNTALRELNKKQYSIFSPQSHCVNFIGKLMNIYNKNNNNINNNEMNKDNNNINNELNEDMYNKKIFEFLGIDTFNQISLRNLFHKNKAKVKFGILDNIKDDKNNLNTNIFMNPFSNSYGVLLNILTEKIGFMKGSIDILYPKITQQRYQIRTLERKKQKNIKRSISQENYKNQKNEIKNNIFNFKQRKIIQSTFTKYPVSIKKIDQNKWSSKMYSFQGQKDLINKKINKTANV